MMWKSFQSFPSQTVFFFLYQSADIGDSFHVLKEKKVHFNVIFWEILFSNKSNHLIGNSKNINCWFTLTYWHLGGFQKRTRRKKNTFLMSLGHYLYFDTKALVRWGVKWCCLTPGTPWTQLCEWHGEKKISAWPLWKSHHYKSSIISASAQGLGLPWRRSGVFGWVG